MISSGLSCRSAGTNRVETAWIRTRMLGLHTHGDPGSLEALTCDLFRFSALWVDQLLRSAPALLNPCCFVRHDALQPSVPGGGPRPGTAARLGATLRPRPPAPSSCFSEGTEEKHQWGKPRLRAHRGLLPQQEGTGQRIGWEDLNFQTWKWFKMGGDCMHSCHVRAEEIFFPLNSKVGHSVGRSQWPPVVKPMQKYHLFLHNSARRSWEQSKILTHRWACMEFRF